MTAAAAASVTAFCWRCQTEALSLCSVSTRLLLALGAGVETETGDAQHCNTNTCLTKWWRVCSLLWAGWRGGPHAFVSPPVMHLVSQLFLWVDCSMHFKSIDSAPLPFWR